MIADVETGKIGGLFTKDLYRLKITYRSWQLSILKSFFKHHVLYIAITDGVDSLTRQKMDITPFKKILTDR